MSLKDELQSIISGNGSVRNGEIIQTIAGYLRREKETIQATAKTKLVKDQETPVLIAFIDSRGLWFNAIDESKYIGEGAEQKIYEFSDPTFVLKLNDSIFKEFLTANGFINKKNNDYYHPELGIILEDLDDENVLTEEGSLQFIDTVFFLLPAFFEKT